MVLSFLLAILLGAFLLVMPFSGAEGSIGWLDALFTSTSAVCVTGLVVLDTGRDFSGFGQTMILILIQFGGLGMMVWSSGVVLFLGGRLGLQERVTLRASMPGLQLADTAGLVRGAIVFVLACEGVGAILLWLMWAPSLGWGQALPQAVFHSVSAFCNAGFSLWGDSLSRDVGRWDVNLVVMILIILGGLGFLICFDLWQARLKRRRPTLHTRIAVATSVGLVLLGSLLFLVFERSNPQTLGSLSWPAKVLASVFQSVTTRTAGFNTVDIGSCFDETLQVMMFLMLIGGCPGSTAGGLKTTTFALLLIAIWNYLLGRREATFCDRKIPEERIIQSLAILGIMGALVWVGSTALSATLETLALENLFEAVSAVATVGLSTGVTAELQPFGKLVIIGLMFAGRVGPLTLAVALIDRSRQKSPFRYVREDVSVG